MVPVPPCFDPEAPLTSNPAHVTVSMTEYKQMSESHHGSFSLNLSGHTSLDADVRSGPASASYTGQKTVTSVGTTLEATSDIVQRSVTSVEKTLEASSDAVQRSFTCVETTLEAALNRDERSVTSVETTLEATADIGQTHATSVETTLQMASRTSTEEENRVFGLADETVPLLPEPLIPEPGLDASAAVQTPPDLPIIDEPLPAPEPAQDDNNDADNDGDDSDSHDGPAQPEVNSQPIAAQPVSGTDEPPPVALQPEPSTPVNVVPTTVRTTETVLRIPSSSSDFPSNVVSDVLSTAIDAVASAGRAVITTVDNFLAGGPRPQTTATYNPQDGCEISVTPPVESDPPVRVR